VTSISNTTIGSVLQFSDADAEGNAQRSGAGLPHHVRVMGEGHAAIERSGRSASAAGANSPVGVLVYVVPDPDFHSE